MKRAHLSMFGGAIALLVVTAANAEAPSAPAPENADTARVESAGADGGLPTRTADVQSAEYDAQRPAAPVPSAASGRLPLLVAAAAGAVAIGVFYGLRNRHRTPRA